MQLPFVSGNLKISWSGSQKDSYQQGKKEKEEKKILQWKMCLWKTISAVTFLLPIADTLV